MPSRSPTRRPEELLPLTPPTFHILLALADGERHGYAIMREVDALTAGRMRLGPGTLYRSIQRMLDQDLIVEVTKRLERGGRDDSRRRYYRITPFGTAVARAEVRRLTQLVRLARARGLTPETA